MGREEAPGSVLVGPWEGGGGGESPGPRSADPKSPGGADMAEEGGGLLNPEVPTELVGTGVAPDANGEVLAKESGGPNCAGPPVVVGMASEGIESIFADGTLLSGNWPGAGEATGFDSLKGECSRGTTGVSKEFTPN